jgi:putative DNA primase/helicase
MSWDSPVWKAAAVEYRSIRVVNGGDASEDQSPAFSDDALALQFAELHEPRLRYVAQWNKWFFWDATSWKEDATPHYFNFSRQICRKAATACNKGKSAKGLASSSTVAAVVSLARSDRRLAATIDQWDADPWLLNTPGGTIDLRTGERHPHESTDYITQCTSISPGGACPLWQQFLQRITNGDEALQQFLQRMAGYALTGLTQEHALFFLYGTGANGKSVFVNTISGILGSYHRTAPIETFTASNSDRHPTELAGLRAARLVTAIETEEGRRWAESKIKVLTGGDKIAARFMRQDFFEFTPQFKLVIAGNHKPGLRSVDEAIRRRFNLVPFVVTIPPNQRDKTLTERLQQEWPGILQWMIDGCIDWQERTLAAPEAVTSATAAYLESEDAVAAWIEDCAERDPNAWEKSIDLFASWTTWATKAGEYAGAQKGFGEKLEARGMTFKRHNKARGYLGLRLRLDGYSVPYQ